MDRIKSVGTPYSATLYYLSPALAGVAFDSAARALTNFQTPSCSSLDDGYMIVASLSVGFPQICKMSVIGSYAHYSEAAAKMMHELQFDFVLYSQLSLMALPYVSNLCTRDLCRVDYRSRLMRSSQVGKILQMEYV